MKNIKFVDNGYGRGTLFINQLDSPAIYSETLKTIRYINKSKGIGNITLDFDKVYNHTYPNCLVPMSGLIDYFKKNEDINIKIVKIRNNYLNKTSFINAPIVTKSAINSNKNSIFDKVWKFSNPKETKLIADQVFKEIFENYVCESGVLTAITWCINEVMDNVLRHSQVNNGFFMCQHHSQSKRLAFAIYDYGIGFYNSLYKRYSPRNYGHAIQLAMTEYVTSDEINGRGFGLYGLNQIIKLNQGSLNISSMSSTYLYKNDGRIRDDYLNNSGYISPQRGTVLVDFQLDYTKKTDITEVLPGSPYEQFDVLLDILEDENKAIHFVINEHSESTGNRKSGIPVRNQLLNIYNQSSGWIIIDFKEVNYIASSFADEVIAKLIENIGEESFNKRFRIRNIKADIQDIISYSINDRLKK